MSTKTRPKAKQKDKFELYEESVQDPATEVAFIRRVYRRLRKKPAVTLREDFCGTAILACDWVRRVPGGTSLGIDLDRPTLDYARKHRIVELGAKADRVRLIHGDVCDAEASKPDVVAAFNFSYFIFKSRAALRQYFSRVYETLGNDGVFFLDLYGGPEAQRVQEERSRQKGFTYIWDQAQYNPITGETLCHIHFEFPDGTRMKRAFTYDWRLWSLPEVKDILLEVGFKTVDVYWEGTDEDTMGGNGIFRLSKKGDDSLSWIAYLSAAK